MNCRTWPVSRDGINPQNQSSLFLQIDSCPDTPDKVVKIDPIVVPDKATQSCRAVFSILVEFVRYLFHDLPVTNRFVKVLLLVLSLSAVIMPVHAYAHVLFEDTHAETGVMPDYHHDQEQSVSCDHCCHYSSHALALLLVCQPVAAIDVALSLSLSDSTYHSRHREPPYHPPIA